jgi:sulfur-carrier protein
MKITVLIPSQLRDLTNGRATIWVDAITVADALESVCSECPGIKPRLFDESGALRRFINVFVEDEDMRFLDGLSTELTDGQTISILPAIAGG